MGGGLESSCVGCVCAVQLVHDTIRTAHTYGTSVFPPPPSPHPHGSTALVDLSLLIIEVPRSHSARLTTFGRTPPEGRSAVAETCTWKHTHKRHIHVPGGIRTCDPKKRATADPRRRLHGHWDRHMHRITFPKSEFRNTCVPKTFDKGLQTRFVNVPIFQVEATLVVGNVEMLGNKASITLTFA